MSPTPLALTPALPSELLTYILTHQTYTTTLLICQERQTFFNSLLTSVPPHIQPQPPPPEDTNSPNEPPEQGPLPKPPSGHHLLIPTLHQIATSRHIKIVYVPTISHLRAYLSVFPPPESEKPPAQEQVFDKPGKKASLLVSYGLLELHRNTSEWSAQGLRHTLAGLVEAGWRGGRRVVLLEERVDEGVGGWEERVPMLNGSVKRAGLESEDGGWSGRTIEVGRIVGMWFKFGKGVWEVSA